MERSDKVHLPRESRASIEIEMIMKKFTLQNKITHESG